MAIDQGSLIRVFDKMDEGVLVLESGWRILYSNSSARRYLGLSESAESISSDLRPKLQRDFILTADIANLDDDREHSIDFEAMNPEDRSYDMTLSLYMSRATDEGTRILLIRDITDEQRERELKQDFLSFISHKLRTPVSTLKVSLSNLRDGVLGSLSDAQIESLELSQRKVASLERVIDKLITFTSLRDERVRAEACYIDAMAVARELCELHSRKVLPKRVSFQFGSKSDDTEIHFRASLFKTLLECIVDNSVKFSNNEDVSIEILFDKDGTTGEIVMSISDDGPGMPPSTQQNAFQPFTQRDDEFTGNVAGLGLGLATVNYLMKLYGGRALLESTPGNGTTVKLVFAPKTDGARLHCAEEPD